MRVSDKEAAALRYNADMYMNTGCDEQEAHDHASSVVNRLGPCTEAEAIQALYSDALRYEDM